MSNIGNAIQWMLDRRAEGMRYSMSLRTHANYSDCSSAVFRALKYAGFPVPYIGNTETMFQLRGTLFTPISRSEIRAGDVFVSGVPGGSANAYGHAGFALNATEAIHSTSVVNGIRISSNADSAVGAYGGAPVYWLRVIGATEPETPTDPIPDEELITLDEEFIDHTYLQSVFGIRVGEEQFDNIDNQLDLRQKGMDFMDAQLDAFHETTASILELGLIDNEFELIEEGTKHSIKVEGYMTNGNRRVIGTDLDLLKPEISVATFGTRYKTLVDYLMQ